MDRYADRSSVVVSWDCSHSVQQQGQKGTLGGNRMEYYIHMGGLEGGYLGSTKRLYQKDQEYHLEERECQFPTVLFNRG